MMRDALLQARRTQSADLAAEAVAELAARIRRARAKVWNVGGPLQWDWYEIAVETWLHFPGEWEAILPPAFLLAATFALVGLILVAWSYAPVHRG